MNTARKGRRYEHRARRMLEDVGYEVIRSAASRGHADLVAWNAHEIRFVQVKCGSAFSAQEREAFQQMPVPPNGTREVWRFVPRVREPLREVV